MEGERGLSGKSMQIHNISAEFPSCNNERTIKYADTYVPELLHRNIRIGKCSHEISKWCETMKKSDDSSAGKSIRTSQVKSSQVKSSQVKSSQVKSSQVILLLIKNFTHHFTLLVERSQTIEIGMVHNGGKQEGKEGG